MKNITKRIVKALILAAGIVLTGCATASLPSDKELLDKFPSLQTDLGKLAEMMKQDSGLDVVTAQDVNAVDPGNAATPRAPAVSAGRLAEYRSLLNRVGAKSITRDKQGIGITIFGELKPGSFDDMSWKGYFFAEGTPAPLASTLDGVTGKSAYRHISGTWYLFFEQDT